MFRSSNKIRRVFLSRSLLFPGGVVVLLGMAGAMPLAQAAKPGKVEAKPQDTPVVPIIGKAVPVEKSKVITMVSGTVEQVHVMPGDLVTEGQLLVEIDAAQYQRAVKAAKVRYKDKGPMQRAEGEHKMRHAEYRKTQDRHRKRLATDHDLSRAQGLLDLAEGKILSARTQKKLHELELENARRQLEKRRITSPAAGVVIEVTKTPGLRASAGDVLVRIGDPSEMRLNFRLPAHLARQFEPGNYLLVRDIEYDTLRHVRITSISPDRKSKDGDMIAQTIMDDSSHTSEPPRAGSYALAPNAGIP